ncbi:hypothetical protein FV227_24000 [Methylobacterium sp. WL119]|uniref:hypothetical protein n=1 Tax=Methylobacterium sp. WL119 TaxID=2603888 RepID=UPI0011CA187D|nr:hypothetical protein [Methylobacterium sp. WL119]TXN46115.1 hypothetical protein FV227_24000 [Methylobacterium sp. WL119]
MAAPAPKSVIEAGLVLQSSPDGMTAEVALTILVKHHTVMAELPRDQPRTAPVVRRSRIFLPHLYCLELQ